MKNNCGGNKMENENWINKITEGYQIYVVGQNPTKKVNDVPLLDQFDLLNKNTK